MAAKPPSSPAESIHRQLETLCNSDDSIPWEPPRRFTSYAGRLHRITGNLLRLSPEILSSPTVHTALKGISGDLVKAVETVSVYRERSKIFVLINCRSLCSSLQDRTAAIGGWLALLETGLKDVTDVRKKVSDLSRDMKQAQFSVTENEMRVYSTLQNEGQGRPIAKPVQSAIIMDLARALGIDPTNHAELLEHVKLLKNDLARSNSVSERRILMSLQRVIDSWSAEPNISALSLDFDMEDESQILPFKNFICPLTKEVMKDPVVLESAQTYERTAIEYWFQRCLEDGRDPTCPVTGQVLRSLEQQPNIGLAGAIEEWVNRNVDIHIKSAVKHLSKDPPSMDFVERVLDSIYKISEEHPSSRYKIRNAGVVLLIINLLKNCSKSICSALKSKALMALLSMAKDEDSKTIMIGGGITKLAIKSLAGSTEKEKEKENALRLLIEFTDNEAYCAKIASEKGAFLLLSSMAENLECPTLSNIAEDVLKRLEVIDENVEHLAAAGRFEPLLSRLCEGSRDIQIEMASLLGKMTLTNCSKEQIANRSAKVLVEMLHKPETRAASLHALCNLSSLDDNATILVEASVLPAVTDIILESQDVLSEQKELAAAIIANIVTSPGHWELAEVNKDGHLMLSSFVVSHLMRLLPQVTPQCQVSILRILCGIASSPKACDQVATDIKSGDGIKSIMEYLEHPETQHRIYALKLMRILSESSGGEFFDQLRLLNKVVLLKEKVLDNQSTNSERSDAACILANFTLSGDEVRTILGAAFLKWTVTTLKEIQHTPNGRTSRSSSSMLEGLLGLLLHFARNTNAQTLAWVKEHHLIAIFREQLSYLSRPRCKHLAVLGLKHLSESGKVLVSEGESDPLPPQGFCSSMVFMCGRLSPELSRCPIHNAPCEEDSELCLLKSNCIKPLVDLLLDEHTDVQIASVEALSSLIPDTFYSFRRAADELDRLGVADAVVALFIEVRPGELQEKAIWMVTLTNFPPLLNLLYFLSPKPLESLHMGAATISDGMEVASQAPVNGTSDVLSSSLSVDTSLPLPAMKPRVIELCKDIFEKWSNLDDSCFAVDTVAGGITNLLLKVTVKEEDGNEVSITVRLYGPNTDYVVNRERELLSIRYLSAAGFGAKLLALFENGMVQSFINARTLTPPDMRDPKLAAMIARELRKFHEVEIPGSKDSQLWIDLSKFFEKASKLKFDDNEKQEKYQTISFEEVQNEINELKALTDCLDAPVVFSHNDLLSGNLMLNEEEGKLYIIDFEYGSYNYRGFDIGNHFNEYAGYDCDYTLYPSKDEQYHFFRHYLCPNAPEEVPDCDLEALYVEANAFMLASHLCWALWALIQAKMSPIDFDYLSYFFLRYNEYKKQKEDVFSSAKSYLSKSQS